jgi:hypothetical protein
MAARKPRRRVSRVASRRPAPRRTRRATNGGNVWSREEIAFMRKYYKQYPTSWVARQLGRTAYAVRYKASDLSIKKARPSVWRANTGSSQPKTNWRRKTARPSWSRQSRWSRRPARRAQSRRRITRKATSRRRSRRH